MLYVRGSRCSRQRYELIPLSPKVGLGLVKAKDEVKTRYETGQLRTLVKKMMTERNKRLIENREIKKVDQ